MKISTLLRLIRFWPPLLGAGIKVASFTPDYLRITVQMNLHFWNRNYVGSHFGGSLYSMTDPFYMLMLMHFLGKEYIVWDKPATIRYKIPARGKVFATFELSPEYINQLRSELEQTSKIEPEFTILVTDESGVVVTEIKKIIHISKKSTLSAG